MRGKYFLALFFLVACAKPNYQEIAKPQIQNDDEGKPTPAACELFLTQQRLCIAFAWKTLPTEKDMGSFTFKFYVQETPHVFVEPTQGTPAVQLWMPSMGHGSSPVSVQKISEGQYEATKVFFIMPGEWNIRLQLKDGKNVIEQAIKTITI